MTSTCDTLVVGGGIMGLWAAKYAAEAGLAVTLVDQGRVGGGGSNGLLGALLPHLPSAANDRKRFQWQALAELPRLIAEVEAATGLPAGYRRCGRLMPLRSEGYRQRLQPCVEQAGELWRLAGQRYRFEIVDPAPFADWLDATAAPLGLVFDDLSARAAPRQVTAALRAAIAPGVTIIEGFDFVSFDEASGRALARDGRSLIARQVVLAAGYQTYALIGDRLGGTFGSGVKGHSALFRLAGGDDRPILYDDGVYVVPHDGGLVAVGSTSEADWSDAHAVDAARCQPFIDKAMALCPRLLDAELVALWAGVRPRSAAKEPICGRLFPDREIYVLTGGYKISFGIAHRLARALVERIVGLDVPLTLPESYTVGYHLAESRRDNRLFPR